VEARKQEYVVNRKAALARGVHQKNPYSMPAMFIAWRVSLPGDWS